MIRGRSKLVLMEKGLKRAMHKQIPENLVELKQCFKEELDDISAKSCSTSIGRIYTFFICCSMEIVLT